MTSSTPRQGMMPHAEDSNTAAASANGWQREPPAGADIHAAWAETILDSLPASGLGCATTDQQLLAASVHATLAVAARLGEVADAIRAGGDVAGELEALRVGGISEVGVVNLR